MSRGLLRAAASAFRNNKQYTTQRELADTATKSVLDEEEKDGDEIKKELDRFGITSISRFAFYIEKGGIAFLDKMHEASMESSEKKINDSETSEKESISIEKQRHTNLTSLARDVIKSEEALIKAQHQCIQNMRRVEEFFSNKTPDQETQATTATKLSEKESEKNTGQHSR